MRPDAYADSGCTNLELNLSQIVGRWQAHFKRRLSGARLVPLLCAPLANNWLRQPEQLKGAGHVEKLVMASSSSQRPPPSICVKLSWPS